MKRLYTIWFQLLCHSGKGKTVQTVKRSVLPWVGAGGVHRQSMHACVLSCVRLCATPWTVAHQAPLSMGFSWQKYCSGLPFSSPGDLPNPGIEFMSLALLLLSRVSHVWLCATPWTAAYQAPLSMGVSRQEYWSGSPVPSPSLALVGRFSFYHSATWEAHRAQKISSAVKVLYMIL